MAQNRMAGDKMKEAAENGDLQQDSYTPPSEEELKRMRERRARKDESAQAAGYRDNVERNRGTEWYNEALKEGLQKGTKGGRYTGAEVRAEMRAGRGDRTVDEMREYFQGLIDDGVKFNNNARDFLADKHGLTFTDSGGDKGGGGDTGGGGDNGGGDGGGTTDPTPVKPQPVPDGPDQNIGYQPPRLGYPGFGDQIQNVNQDNDIISNVTGNNNTVTNTQDNSVSQYGGYSFSPAQRSKHLRDQYVANVSRFTGA